MGMRLQVSTGKAHIQSPAASLAGRLQAGLDSSRCQGTSTCNDMPPTHLVTQMVPSSVKAATRDPAPPTSR